MYMVKKKKSVERTKEDKSKILVKNNNNATNKNTNTQITQIIFPADMEIRTKKKKRKGKSTTQKKKEEEKKELLEMLKSKLNEYDNIQELAQQKKIPIPNDLALSVISQEDLKTNEDIENYINDITQKINAITQLLNKPINPFSVRGFPVRMGSGTINSGVILPTRPQIINPSLIEREPINNIPINNIPRDLAEIKKELEGEVNNQIKEGDLKLIEIKVGENIFKIKAPNGFEDLFNEYKKYIEDLQKITLDNQIMSGIYHIPILKYNQLIKQRDTLRINYDEWIDNLPERLQTFMETDNNVKGINADIFGQTQIEPKELSKFLFQKENIEFTEITQGNEKPKIEKDIQERGFKNAEDEKLRKEFDELIAEISGKINIIWGKIETSNGNKQKLDALIIEIEQLKGQLAGTYARLPEQVQLSGIVEVQVWEKRLDTVIDAINTKLNPVIVRTDIVADNPELVKPNRQKLTPAQKRAKKKIMEYIKSNGKSIKTQLAIEINNYFGEEKGNNITKELRGIGNKTDDEVERKKKRLKKFMSDGIDAQDVLGVM